MGEDRETRAREQMAPLRRELAAWRRQATVASKMPEEVWQRAVECAREHGTEIVGQYLQLDHGILRRRLLASATASTGEGTQSGFIELSGAQLLSASPLARRGTIEFCRHDGARMLIHMSDESAVDVLSLTALFLEGSA